MKENQHNTQQLEKEVKRLKITLEELTVLNDLAIAAGSSMEVDQVLNVIVQKSIKAMKAEQGSISLVTEQETTPLKTLIRRVNHTNQLQTYRVGSHITGWVLKHQQPLKIDSLAMDERFKPSVQEKKEIRSVLCVPIWSRAKIIGVLMMINKKTDEPFNSDDIRLLSIIAAQSGQLIRNSQLQEEAFEKQRMEQELALACHIQKSLLPKQEPETPSLDVASYFNPAAQVGGDYYDYFVFGDQKIGILIADVSGHGQSSAMIMTMVKGILHSITHKFTSADLALFEINSIISRILPREIFVTMMFLVFDLKKKVLRFSNAGHNPFVFYNSLSKTCQMIELKGCALNLLGNTTYSLKKIPLNPDDVFLIYTDGVTEAINENMDMFEENRLIQAVEEVVSKPAAKIIEHIKTKLDAFTGEKPQADDIVMIAVKIKGVG